MQVVYRVVEMVRGDVSRDRCRYEIVDRLACGEPGADRARRHVARTRLHKKNRCAQPRAQRRRTRGSGVEPGAWTRDDDEVRRIEDGRKFAPRGNFCEGVAAENEENLR